MSLNTMRENFGHNAKWILGFVTLAMLITTFGWNLSGRGGTNAADAGAKVADEVIGTADGEKITRGDYDKAVRSMGERMGGGSAMMAGFIRSQALTQVLQGAELLAAAKKMGLTASQADIDAMREKILKSNEIRKTLGLPDSATVADIDAKLQASGNGTVAQLFPDVQIERAAILDKLEKRLSAGTVVTVQDAKDSFIKYHTRHILIDNKKRSDEQAKKMAADLLAKAKAPGADFAALAKANSDDPGTKAKGGDDGFVDDKTGYVTEFMDAAKKLKPGEVSDIVPSPQFGYFIIKLEAVKNDLPKDFDKIKDATIKSIEETRKNKAENDFMTALNAAPHTVTFTDPAVRADYEVIEAQKLQSEKHLSQTDPVLIAKYHAAAADYKAAIAADKRHVDDAANNMQLASVYQFLGDKAGALSANVAAAEATGDPSLWITVGNAYKEQKNEKEALNAFANASKNANGMPYIHQQLETTYRQMGQTALAATEADLFKTQQAAQPQPPMGGAGSPISLTPGGGQPITISAPPAGGKGVTVTPSPKRGAKPVTVDATPSKGAPKPGQ